MTKRQRIGNIGAKDIWAFAFRCLGAILFPVLLLMPLWVIWRIFFYEPEDFWRIVRWGSIYVAVVTAWMWLKSYKTILECDGESLFIIKKRGFLVECGKKQIPLTEIKAITFAEVKVAKSEPKKIEKMFRLKFVYNLFYGLGKHLLNKGKMNVCLIYGEPQQTFVIDDIKKNDERYSYLKELEKGR